MHLGNRVHWENNRESQMKVDNEVMALLSASRTEDSKLFITGGQLDKNLYQRLDKKTAPQLIEDIKSLAA